MNNLAVESKPSSESANDRETWIFPTSFSQRRLWFIDQLEPGAPLYNLPCAYRVRGGLNPRLLERSIGEVIARHEILRTTFKLIDGEPMQVVAANAEFQLPVVDLRALAADAREAEVARIIAEESEHLFDLGKGPLLRAVLLELGSSEQVLVLVAHDIICDCWSQEVIMRELTTAYSALANGAASSLTELPVQYADFAAWQRNRIQGEILEKELAFWRERLAGVVPLNLPHLPIQAEAPVPEGGIFRFDLPEPLSVAIRALARSEGVTLFMALLAGWKVFLARHTGQTDIAVATLVADRSRAEIEELIGSFGNTLVLRTGLEDTPTTRDALRRVRKTALDAFTYQNVPFEVLAEDLHSSPLRGKNPLLRVMFVLHASEEKTWQTRDATLEPMPIAVSRPQFDLMLRVRDTGRSFSCALIYDEALFTPEMIGVIVRQYANILSGMAAHPEGRIDSLRLDEREILPLDAGGDPAMNEPAPPDLAKTPGPAVIESQNTLQSHLVEIWQEVLEHKPIGIRDNFFDLGGHSLLAMRMLAMVEERLGVRPALSTLFENGTIEHLAASLLKERQEAASEQPFVAIHPEGTKTPFFFLHGDFVGGGFFCRGLAREIGEERPFYAIHPHGLQGDEPPRSIPVMAAERLAIIREIQPHGPYLLGGYCNGALVAFEMARLLEAEGEKAPVVVIFTANGAGYHHRLCQRLAGIVSTVAGDGEIERAQRFLRWRRTIEFWLSSVRHYAASARDLVRQPWREQSRRFTGKMRRIMHRAFGETIEGPACAPANEQRLWDLYSDASDSYVPHRFGGKLVLLWPSEQCSIEGNASAYGWKLLSPEVEIVTVPGDHDTSITRKDNLSVAGLKIRRVLDAADAPDRIDARGIPATSEEIQPESQPIMETASSYELVIEPSHSWINIQWRELWEYRDLLVLLVRRDFLSKYRQTLLGPAWFVIQPLLTTMMFAVIFGRVAQIPTDGIPGPLFYLCGLLVWNYFSQNVTTGATTFSVNAQLFGKVYFPRVILPAAAIISNLYAFALQFAPFLAFFVYYKFCTVEGQNLRMDWHVIFVPLILLQASLFSLGVSLWMSASTAKYRDLVHLNQFLIQLWMFATPIIYPLSRIPHRYAWLAWLNPMAEIVEALRISLLGRGTITPGCMAMSVVLTILVAVSGIIVFQKMERTAVDNI